MPNPMMNEISSAAVMVPSSSSLISNLWENAIAGDDLMNYSSGKWSLLTMSWRKSCSLSSSRKYQQNIFELGHYMITPEKRMKRAWPPDSLLDTFALGDGIRK